MTFPNVPFAPGVPALPRDPNAINAGLTLLVADVISFFLDTLAPRWGLFKNGVPVVVCESVIDLDYKQDWAVANYPLEKGAFESYDKVAHPFDVRLKFSAGGSEFERAALLASVEAIAGTLELFDAYTPEKIYPSVNVTHFDYRRTATNGVGLLVIDVWCVQVRNTAQASFSNAVERTQSPTGGGAFGSANTKEPSGADPVGIGSVQATPAPLSIPADPIR